MERKYSVFLGNVGACSDRYCKGYSGSFSMEELFDRVVSVPHIRGVDLVVDEDFLANSKKILPLVKKSGLSVVSLNVDLFSRPDWKQGSFSSVSAAVRKKAKEFSLRVMDTAAEFGCGLVVIWPGQDGYDYLFQADYISERKMFADGIRHLCRHNPEITIGLEYKLKEPRNRCYLSSAAVSILTVNEINEPNCGVVLDYGHALFAQENPAESVALLHTYGNRLRHIHINDNYRYWDDDMIVGSVHTLEFLEFIYWLRRTGYDGWITMDQFPYREDGRDAVAESAAWLDALENIIDTADFSKIDEALKAKNGIVSSRLMRELLFR